MNKIKLITLLVLLALVASAATVSARPSRTTTTTITTTTTTQSGPTTTTTQPSCYNDCKNVCHYESEVDCSAPWCAALIAQYGYMMDCCCMVTQYEVCEQQCTWVCPTTTTSTTTTTTTTSTTSTTTTTTTTTSTTTTTRCGYLKVFKFNDTNANRVWDDGENPLGGFTFNITGETESGHVSYTGTTTEYGEIFLQCIPYGNYTVTENVPSGWVVTTANPQEVQIVVQNLQEARFGNRQTTTTTTTSTTTSTTTTTTTTSTTTSTTTTTTSTSTTTTTTSSTTTSTSTTTTSSTSTTVPNAPEYPSEAFPVAILLAAPALAYLTIKKK